MSQLSSLLPFLLMFVIFYFLLIRPQQKKQRERNNMLRAIKKGDQVVTVGGLHGTVNEINDQTVSLRVAHNVIMTFERSSIGSVRTVAKQEPASEKVPAEKPSTENA